MESSLRKSVERKKKRVLRIRKRIKGTQERPRMSISKSNKQLFVQLIDDENGQTLVSLNSLNKDVKRAANSTTVETAKEMGVILAKKVAEKGIKSAVLDRRGNKYHGQIAAIADTLREKGIKL